MTTQTETAVPGAAAKARIAVLNDHPNHQILADLCPIIGEVLDVVFPEVDPLVDIAERVAKLETAQPATVTVSADAFQALCDRVAKLESIDLPAAGPAPADTATGAAS